MPALRIEHSVTRAANDVDALVAFVREAIGCASEEMTRIVEADPPEMDTTTFTASSAERTRAAIWRLESASSSVRVERNEAFFPGDVNEPPRGSVDMTVTGVRRGGPTVKVRTLLDDDVSIDVEASPEEIERIFDLFRRTFATAKSFVRTFSS